ncbi:MAG: F0F1 ATP synthase subunit B [Bacteroidota bacterium]
MNLVTPDFGLVFWQTIILLVVLFILGKFAWGPILQTIQERERNIEQALTAATVARKTVERVEAAQALLIEKAHAEREEIIAAALDTQHAILEEAKGEAKRLSQQLLEQAGMEIEEARQAALASLKNEVATVAVQIAEKLLAKELSPQSRQKELVESLLAEASWN